MRKFIYVLFLLLLAGCGKSEQAPAKITIAAEKTTTETPISKPFGFYPPAVKMQPEFEFDAETFKNSFNAASKFYEQRFQINKAFVKDGSVNNVFQHIFSDRISLTAGVSKRTGHIINITAVVAGNGESLQSGLDMLAMSLIVTKATNQNLTNAEVTELVLGMMKESNENKVKGNVPERTINNVHYMLRTGEGLGYWWIVDAGA